MQFLKNHYEKIILTVLLILFVCSLFYLINVIKNVQVQIGPETLKLPKVRPDYSPADFKQEKFNVVAMLNKGAFWEVRKQLNPQDKVFTQLNVPYPIAKCPHCKKFVQRYAFMNDPHKCPLCGGDLPEPPDFGKMAAAKLQGMDSDNDSIPDQLEKKLGLNPNEPSDARQDMDKDGFPNFVEIEQETDIKDAKSHPPLALRLYVYKIYRTKLGVKLKKLQVKGENQSDWDIQLDVKYGRSWRTKFMRLNDVVKVGKEDYKIINCKAKKEEVYDPKLKVTKMMDKSEVTIQSLKTGDKIVMVAGQTVYSPSEKVYLKDVSTGKRYRHVLDDIFKVGSNDTGIESYKVIAIDASQKRVQLKNEATNQILEVSNKPRFEYEQDLDRSQFGGPVRPVRRRTTRKRSRRPRRRRR